MLVQRWLKMSNLQLNHRIRIGCDCVHVSLLQLLLSLPEKKLIFIYFKYAQLDAILNFESVLLSYCSKSHGSMGISWRRLRQHRRKKPITSSRNLVTSYTMLSMTTQHELWSQWLATSVIEKSSSEASTPQSDPHIEPCGDGVSNTWLEWYTGTTEGIEKKI